MRFLRVALALTATLTGHVSAQTGVTGTWKVEKEARIWLTCCSASEMTFALKAEGDKLTGTAHLGSSPGESVISDGVIDGNRVSFVATSKHRTSSGVPMVRFEGTVDGDVLKLTMTTGLKGEREAWPIDRWDTSKHEIEAKRVPN